MPVYASKRNYLSTIHENAIYEELNRTAKRRGKYITNGPPMMWFEGDPIYEYQIETGDNADYYNENPDFGFGETEVINENDPVEADPVDQDIIEITGALPGTGDGTVIEYDPSQYSNSSPDKNYDPNNTQDPKTAGCPPYSHDRWPQECPQNRTFEWMEDVFTPVKEWGDTFRAADGREPMIWDKHLTLAAQMHATFIAEHYELYEPGNEFYDQWGTIMAYHNEPEWGFGAGLLHRMQRVNRGGPAWSEGVGFTTGEDNTPQGGLCTQKTDYVSEDNPGHFGAWSQASNTKDYVGYGFDVDANGRMIHVFNYADNPPKDSADELDELYTYLPKFYCSQFSDSSELYDMPEIGDIKTSIKTTNHSGWYLLNGQTIDAGTHPIASASATSLFGSSTLQDYNYALLGMDTSKQIGTNAGTGSFTLDIANLPSDWLFVEPVDSTRSFIAVKKDVQSSGTYSNRIINTSENNVDTELAEKIQDKGHVRMNSGIQTAINVQDHIHKRIVNFFVWLDVEV
jgi:hypothetical protein